MAERIQKLLAHAGLGSRREIEGWIEAGRIQVNSQTAELGQRIDIGDKVLVDGKPVNLAKAITVKRRVFAYKKHVDQVVTRKDPQGRKTVFQNLPTLEAGRWIPVGRLDINTSGLLLLTTDGELAARLMHPSYQLEREYACRVLGEVTAEMLKRLTEGVELEDGPARFEHLSRGRGEGTNTWYNVVVSEGRNRVVRRLWESQGLKVSRLIRVRYGPCTLPTGVKAGHGVELSVKEVEALAASVGLGKQRQRKKKSRQRKRH